MKRLFDDTVKGLESQGWIVQGGGDMFCILQKDDRVVKVHRPALYKESEHLVVRYSVN